jgi:hypothetical protein
LRFVGCGAVFGAALVRLWCGFGAVRYVYVYVHICTHSNSSRKITKKIPYMQIYMGKSFENVDFATKIGDYSV